MMELKGITRSDLLDLLGERSIKPWMNTYIVGTRNQFRGGLIHYLRGLSPRTLSEHISLLFILANKSEIENLIRNLGDNLIIVERDNSGLPILALDSSRAVLYGFLRIPLKNGAGKELAHGLTMDFNRVIGILQDRCNEILPVLEILNTRTIESGVITTGGQGFFMTSIIAENLLPIGLRSDGILLLPEDPLWRKGQIVALDMALKL